MTRIREEEDWKVEGVQAHFRPFHCAWHAEIPYIPTSNFHLRLQHHIVTQWTLPLTESQRVDDDNGTASKSGLSNANR